MKESLQIFRLGFQVVESIRLVEHCYKGFLLMQNGNRTEYRYYYREVLQFVVWKIWTNSVFRKNRLLGSSCET